MRLFGLTPKILACSVAIHTTALAGFGLSNSSEAPRGLNKATVIGIRLISGGASGVIANNAQMQNHKAMVRHKHQPKPQASAHVAARVPTSTAGSRATDSIQSKPGSSGGSLNAPNQSDGADLTKGLRLIAGTVDLPPYTDDARVAHFEGTLEVEVTIDEQGRVAMAQLLNPSGYDLDTGVVEAARLALYEPPVDDDGHLTSGRARLKFRFHLDHAPTDQRQL